MRKWIKRREAKERLDMLEISLAPKMTKEHLGGLVRRYQGQLGDHGIKEEKLDRSGLQRWKKITGKGR